MINNILDKKHMKRIITTLTIVTLLTACGSQVSPVSHQEGKEYAGDIITAMRSFFLRSLGIARTAGVSDADIILDPGIGFGKTPEANLLVLKRLEELQEIDGQQWPLLLGTSRKSFIGAALDLPITERTEATGATCVWGIMKGCGIVRVHEVASTARMCRMIDKILEAQ